MTQEYDARPELSRSADETQSEDEMAVNGHDIDEPKAIGDSEAMQEELVVGGAEPNYDAEIGDAKPNYDAEIGGAEPLPFPDVDITLSPSRAAPVAGELWSMTGTIKNRSTRPVWIVDTKSHLALPPELYGQQRSEGSLIAFFPTVLQRAEAEVIRIDPRASYSVVWKLSPLPEKEASTVSTLQRILYSIRNFSFFNPGEFEFFSTIHVWTTTPQFESGEVKNIGDSYPITVQSSIRVDQSPWVLILGAIIGGLLCYAAQSLYGSTPTGYTYVDIAKDILIGGLSAMILCAVATILISRLSTTDFLIVIKVKDIWGAVATGFVIQWFGYGLGRAKRAESPAKQCLINQLVSLCKNYFLTDNQIVAVHVQNLHSDYELAGNFRLRHYDLGRFSRAYQDEFVKIHPREAFRTAKIAKLAK